jgi:hypothetical protein
MPLPPWLPLISGWRIKIPSTLIPGSATAHPGNTFFLNSPRVRLNGVNSSKRPPVLQCSKSESEHCALEVKNSPVVVNLLNNYLKHFSEFPQRRHAAASLRAMVSRLGRRQYGLPRAAGGVTTPTGVLGSSECEHRDKKNSDPEGRFPGFGSESHLTWMPLMWQYFLSLAARKN